jgi:hypothetical protein
MSNDIDFDQLIDLLDRALTSKDPKVMQALKKFLFIAALATEESEEKGPFADLIARIETLEAQVRNINYPPGTYTWPPNTSGQTIWYGYDTDTAGNPIYKNLTGGSSSSTTTSMWIGDPGGSTTTTYASTDNTFTVSDAAETLIQDTLNDLTDLQEQAKGYLQKD